MGPQPCAQRAGRARRAGRLLPLLVVVALVAAGCTGASSAASCDEDLPGVRSGLCPLPEEQREAAPTDAVDVLGEDGTQLSVADLAGRVVVLNFWASWCGPCRAEQPLLNEAHGMLPEDEVAFLGVNIEDRNESAALAHEREFDIPYPSLYDPTNLYASKYRGVGPRAIPTTLILDRQGRVAVRLFGSPRSATELVVLADAVARSDDGASAAAGGSGGG